MRISKKISTAVAGVALLSASLSACGGLSGGAAAGSGPCKGVEAGSVDPKALDGVTVKVGSKEFDEQLVLGQLSIKMMCAAGAKAVDKTNIKGTTQVRKALLRGDIDTYWGYTGTGWVDFLKKKPIHDPVKQYEAIKTQDLKKNDVVWGPRAPFNNTYAFAVTNEFAKKNNLKTDSDMASYINSNPSSTVCVESEYANRPDGYPGFKKTYGIHGGQQKVLGIGVVYTQTDKGNCDFGEVFTTDGRIKALGLTVLKDNKLYHPLYNGCPVVMKKTNEEHPEILKVLAPLAKELTTPVMQELNTKVSAQGEDPEKVATDFLKKKGFIK
ncbi:MAG TPA: glycine betaine ABC transporter substrate-binding protein [Nocardioidaceae bacterium]|nr:glycine betaine ABC transporter substrate-binding protein [Nocardioidaceae bacterium]